MRVCVCVCVYARVSFFFHPRFSLTTRKIASHSRFIGEKRDISIPSGNKRIITIPIERIRSFDKEREREREEKNVEKETGKRKERKGFRFLRLKRANVTKLRDKWCITIEETLIKLIKSVLAVARDHLKRKLYDEIRD